MLHSKDIKFGDFRVDNIFFYGPSAKAIEAVIIGETPFIDGTFELEGKRYPILRSQPLLPNISFDSTSANDADRIWMVFSGLDSGVCVLNLGHLASGS